MSDDVHTLQKQVAFLVLSAECTFNDLKGLKTLLKERFGPEIGMYERMIDAMIETLGTNYQQANEEDMYYHRMDPAADAQSEGL